MDVSTGGIMSGVSIPVKPNYQVPFSEQVKAEAGYSGDRGGSYHQAESRRPRFWPDGEADAVEIWPRRIA